MTAVKTGSAEHSELKLPRDSTRQSQGILYGPLSKRINRSCGGVIIAFVIVHVVGLAVVYWGALKPVLHALPWLDGVNHRTWFHAIYFVVFPAVVFHTLYSLKLIAMDFGLRLSYRTSFWTISVLAVAAAFWGAFGYVSH
jgi:succinate dehydrogenase/fumarate reductase cytochrome b subunit